MLLMVLRLTAHGLATLSLRTLAEFSCTIDLSPSDFQPQVLSILFGVKESMEPNLSVRVRRLPST
jgi:hypothetical protein